MSAGNKYDEVKELIVTGKESGYLLSIESIRKYEQEVRRINLKICRCRKNPRLYGKHLYLRARQRIPISRKVRDLKLRDIHRRKLVATIKDMVDRIVRNERELLILKEFLFQ